MMYGNNFSAKDINVVINGKELMKERMQSASYFHSTKIWGEENAHFYYSLHTWRNAKTRWNCSSKELFIDECVDIIDNDNVDDALAGVEFGRPVALLDDNTGRVLWFRMQFNCANKRMEFFIHSVFLRDFNGYSYIYIKDNNTFCAKILQSGDVVVGIENIEEFKLNDKER